MTTYYIQYRNLADCRWRQNPQMESGYVHVLRRFHELEEFWGECPWEHRIVAIDDDKPPVVVRQRGVR